MEQFLRDCPTNSSENQSINNSIKDSQKEEIDIKDYVGPDLMPIEANSMVKMFFFFVYFKILNI
jgi:hypothetical protein